MYGRHRWSGKVAVLSQSRQKLCVWCEYACASSMDVGGCPSHESATNADSPSCNIVRPYARTPPVPSRMLLAIFSDRSPCVRLSLS